MNVLTRGATALCVGALVAVGGASMASAGSSSSDPATPNAPVATATTTLPLFGAQLTVDVTVGAGGTLTSVAVNPADGFTAVKDKPNKVVFENTDGTAKVIVNTRHGGQGVAARAGTLADITGPGKWVGDVFGTGSNTTVDFVVGAQADGTPDITGVTSSDGTIAGDVQHRSHDKHGNGSVSAAWVSVHFVSGVQSRTLWIGATVETRDDTSRATLGIYLGNVRGESLPADQVAGAHTWNGVLCDGTAVAVNYTVATDGTISGVTPTPSTAEVKTRGDNAVSVTFSDHEAVGIRVGGHDGNLKISVDERFRCGRTDPTVNTPVTSTPDNGDDHGHHGGGETGDDRGSSGHGHGHGGN